VRCTILQAGQPKTRDCLAVCHCPKRGRSVGQGARGTQPGWPTGKVQCIAGAHHPQSMPESNSSVLAHCEKCINRSGRVAS
jgi:hypothetical protein